MPIHLVLLISLCMLLHTSSLAGDNPFLSKESETKVVQPRPVTYPGFVQTFIVKISRIQHQLNKQLSAMARKIKNNPSAKILSAIFSIAFLYGVMHALGPGHGKVFAVSYFLAEKADIKKGLLFGNIFAFVHAGSAVVLVISLYFIIRHSVFRTVEDISHTVKLVSYGLIALIGAYLFIVHLTKKLKKMEDQAPGSKSASIALAAGIVPCPGTVIVMLFALSLEMLHLGLSLAFFMALGMAVSLCIIGIATIISRRMAVNLFLKNNKTSMFLIGFLELTGSFAILSLGGVLFIVNL